MAFSVHRIPEVVYGQYRREVVFLASDDANSGLNAEATFNALGPKQRREMLNKFDSWSRGNDGPSHWFHGFTDAGRKHLFVFKRRKGNTRFRYYGFLIHPTPKTNPRYFLCVLVRHAQKNTEDTDPRETNFVNALRVRADVIAAVQKEFPDRTEGKGGRDATLYFN